jgi:hypothetical protein
MISLQAASGVTQRLSDGRDWLPVKAGIVASPAALMPSRRKTLITVIRRMRRSSQKLQFSTYQTSNSNFCGQVSAFRPLT